MAILTVSKKALDAGKAWAPDWYKVTFERMEGPELASSGKSNNYKCFFTNKDGSEIMQYYNDSEGLIGNLVEVYAAAADVPYNECADKQLDFDKIKGAQLFIRVDNEVYKKDPSAAGRIVNRISAYQPISQPPF